MRMATQREGESRGGVCCLRAGREAPVVLQHGSDRRATGSVVLAEKDAVGRGRRDATRRGIDGRQRDVSNDGLVEETDAR